MWRGGDLRGWVGGRPCSASCDIKRLQICLLPEMHVSVQQSSESIGHHDVRQRDIFEINPEWTQRFIGDRRGVKVELAAFAGLTPDKMSRILTGRRAITQREALKIREFVDRADDPDAPELRAEHTSAPLGPDNDVSLSIRRGRVTIQATFDREGLQELRRQLDSVDALLAASEQSAKGRAPQA